MGTLMGKAKDTLGAAGAAAQKAYSANLNKGNLTLGRNQEKSTNGMEMD